MLVTRNSKQLQVAPKQQARRQRKAKKISKQVKLKLLPASTKQPKSFHASSPSMVKKRSGVKAICSLSNPFCIQARGAKWPDGSGEASLPAQLRGHSNISSFANGGALMYVIPCINQSILYPLSYAAGNYTMNPSFSAMPGTASIVTYGGYYRVVTAGIVIRNLLPALTASGYIIVTRQSVMAGVNAILPVGNMYGIESTTHSIMAGMEVPIVFRALGSEARVFQPMGTGLVDWPWDLITIEIVGAPASTLVLDIEWYVNVEFQVLPLYQSLQQYFPINAPSNSVLITAADKAGAVVSTATSTSLERFAAFAEKVATDALLAMADSAFAALMV